MSSLSDLLKFPEIYLHMGFIESYGNGFYTALFGVTLYAMIVTKKAHKTNLGLFLALIMMYILATTHSACHWFIVKNGFIDHGETPTSTALYFVGTPLWITVLSALTLTLNTLIADCILIWRCWIVWNHNWKIIILPTMCTVAGAALGFRSIAEQAAYIINPNLDRNSFVDFATPYFALSLVTTSLATVLIIFRIMTMTESATRKSRGYRRVIEVVVESAVLYSVSLIIFLPLLVAESLEDGYAQAVVVQMTGIAPTLIVARVSLGLSRPDGTWGAPQSTLQSSLGFARRSGSELPNGHIGLSPVYYVGPYDSVSAATKTEVVDA